MGHACLQKLVLIPYYFSCQIRLKLAKLHPRAGELDRALDGMREAINILAVSGEKNRDKVGRSGVWERGWWWCVCLGGGCMKTILTAAGAAGEKHSFGGRFWYVCCVCVCVGGWVGGGGGGGGVGEMEGVE